MAAALSFLLVLALSLVVTRMGATALTMTGVSAESARFQAFSAFLGVGFTTRESELVLANPVRRRIVTLLMLLGNAGVVADISSLVLVFLTAPGETRAVVRAGVLLATLALFWATASSRAVDHGLSRAVEWALRRWTQLDVRDYVSLLRLAGGYGVGELQVQPDAWVAGRTLAEADLRSEGVLVLGIERPGGAYVGVPRGPTRVQAGDVLIAYARADLLDAVDRRRAGAAGDEAHALAVARHHRVLGLDLPEALATPTSSAI